MTPWMILGFADAAPPSAFAQFLPLILVFGIFYFLVIAPMRKRQKALFEALTEKQSEEIFDILDRLETAAELREF